MDINLGRFELFTADEIYNDISKKCDRYDILDDLVEVALQDNIFVRGL